MKSKINKKGKCYENAYHNMLNLKLEGMLLVHGIVSGQKVLEGYRFEHAWNEWNGFVFDFSIPNKPFTSTKESYYKLGKIKEKEVKRYTLKEALEHGTKNGTFGPWHKTGLEPKGYIKVRA